MPDEITIDGVEEHAFRRSIEAMLRNGHAQEAADRLKALLPACAGEGKPLPARMLEITPGQISFSGWDELETKLSDYGRPETPITAIGIGIGDPEDAGLAPDSDGRLSPPLETSFYSDATFPFSETDRDDLLEGYSYYGCEWQGDYDRADETLTIEGIDDLYGAITALENAVGASSNPDPETIQAGAIGACYLGVLIYQAAQKATIEHGLPRPLAILLVNNDAYPFFDAPVMSCDEYRDNGAVKPVEREAALVGAGDVDPFEAEEAEDTGSLISMVTSSPRGKKKMALALNDEEAANPLGMADELVAQAAFDPDSVDPARFMPQAAAEPVYAEPVDAEAVYAESLDATLGGTAANAPTELYSGPAHPAMDDAPANAPADVNAEYAGPDLDHARQSIPAPELGSEHGNTGPADQAQPTSFDFQEIRFPVEATLSYNSSPPPTGDAPEETDLASAAEPSEDSPAPPAEMPGFSADAPISETIEDTVSDWAETAETPDIHVAAEPASPDPAAFPPVESNSNYNAPPAKTAPYSSQASVHMPWHGGSNEMPFSHSPSLHSPHSPHSPPATRTSHSIRSKIRVAPPQPQGPSLFVRLLNSTVRLVKRVHQWIKRR